MSFNRKFDDVLLGVVPYLLTLPTTSFSSSLLCFSPSPPPLIVIFLFCRYIAGICWRCPMSAPPILNFLNGWPIWDQHVNKSLKKKNKINLQYHPKKIFKKTLDIYCSVALMKLVFSCAWQHLAQLQWLVMCKLYYLHFTLS